jgi:hypothetical protein
MWAWRAYQYRCYLQGRRGALDRVALSLVPRQLTSLGRRDIPAMPILQANSSVAQANDVEQSHQDRGRIQSNQALHPASMSVLLVF